jgi:hypothetical protein
VNGFGKAKARLDKHMGGVPHFVIHDLRRTVRTRLSALTTYQIAELVIGHGKKGLARVYDQHEYLDEIPEALKAARLRSIVSRQGQRTGADMRLARQRRATCLISRYAEQIAKELKLTGNVVRNYLRLRNPEHTRNSPWMFSPKDAAKIKREIVASRKRKLP